MGFDCVYLFFGVKIVTKRERAGKTMRRIESMALGSCDESREASRGSGVSFEGMVGYAGGCRRSGGGKMKWASE